MSTMTHVTCPTVLLALLTDLMEQDPLWPRQADAANGPDLSAVFESLRRQPAPMPDADNGRSASPPHHVAPGTLSTGLAVLVALELLADRFQPATFATIDGTSERLQLVIEDPRLGDFAVAIAVQRRDRATAQRAVMAAALHREQDEWQALINRART